MHLPFKRITRLFLFITVPIIEYSIENLSNILEKSTNFFSEIINSMRSWDSEIIISIGVNDGNFLCTNDNSTSNPLPKVSDNSERQHASPPPPKSLIALMQRFSTASVIASINNFSKNG